jgi:hypothetical protein
MRFSISASSKPFTLSESPVPWQSVTLVQGSMSWVIWTFEAQSNSLAPTRRCWLMQSCEPWAVHSGPGKPKRGWACNPVLMALETAHLEVPSGALDTGSPGSLQQPQDPLMAGLFRDLLALRGPGHGSLYLL